MNKRHIMKSEILTNSILPHYTSYVDRHIFHTTIPTSDDLFFVFSYEISFYWCYFIFFRQREFMVNTFITSLVEIVSYSWLIFMVGGGSPKQPLITSNSLVIYAGGRPNR
jgi:uncharacterized membrane protein YdjX (TVP38/TMEM64 family)